MEAIGEEINLRYQMVKFTLGEGSIRASLPLFNEGVNELVDDSAEFSTDPDEADEVEESEADTE